MTNVITDIKDFIETEEIIENYQTPRIDMILDFMLLKKIAKRSKNEIEKYTESNKEIRNGKRVLAGTRITTKELIIIMSENENQKNIFEYISKQYPSIDSEAKILYGALYELKKVNSIRFILGVLLKK